MKRSDRELISSMLEKKRRKISGVDRLIDELKKSFLPRYNSRGGKSRGDRQIDR